MTESLGMFVVFLLGSIWLIAIIGLTIETIHVIIDLIRHWREPDDE